MHFTLWRGQRVATVTKLSLSEPSFRLPASREKKTEPEGVCRAKNEKSGKEECNRINKIVMNERRGRYKMKDKTFV